METKFGTESHGMGTEAKPPAQWPAETRTAFEALVRDGGQVGTTGLAGWVARAAALACHHVGNKLVGVAALKRPTDSYRTKVSKWSGFALSQTALPLELGWLYILPEDRGRGLSNRLVAACLEAAGPAGVFETTREDNDPMRCCLAKNGFKHVGRPYKGDCGDYNLVVYARVARGADPSAHPATIDTMNMLGILLQRKGKVGVAEKLFRKAAGAIAGRLGERHHAIARPLTNLASIFVESDRFREAEEIYQHVLDLLVEALGPDHIEVASARANLGYVNLRMGQGAKAKSHYEKSLAIRTKVLGPQHPDVASALGSLALIADRDGDRNKADENYRRTLSIFSGTMFHGHRDHWVSLTNYAAFLRRCGRHDEAETAQKAAMELGPHSDTPDWG